MCCCYWHRLVDRWNALVIICTTAQFLRNVFVCSVWFSQWTPNTFQRFFVDMLAVYCVFIPYRVPPFRREILTAYLGQLNFGSGDCFTSSTFLRNVVTKSQKTNVFFKNNGQTQRLIKTKSLFIFVMEMKCRREWGEAGTICRDPTVRKGARGPCMLHMFCLFR